MKFRVAVVNGGKVNLVKWTVIGEAARCCIVDNNNRQTKCKVSAQECILAIMCVINICQHLVGVS